MAPDRYTRLINWLKVVFPLMALGLLSTLFLLSRAIDPEAQIPFADKEIQDRLRNQQVTGPFFTGTTADGDLVSFAAETLTTPGGQTGANQAEDVRVTFDLASGAEVVLVADHALVDMAQDQAELSGAVLVSTSTDYSFSTDLLTAKMSALNIVSPGPVEGKGPPGKLNAGRMELTSPEQGKSAQLIFKEGVKLIYTPQPLKE